MIRCPKCYTLLKELDEEPLKESEKLDKENAKFRYYSCPYCNTDLNIEIGVIQATINSH